jgi:phage virion morphogenesis protein
MISVTFDDQEVKNLLDRLHRKLGDLKPAMNEVGQRYERRLLEGWEAEQAPDGTPWKPTTVLSNTLGFVGTEAGTKKKKAYTKAGGMTAAFQRYLAEKKILVLSGRMRSRLHYQADAKSMAIGVAGIPYAAIHQFGGKAGRGRKVTIPARPWLAMNTPDGGLALAERDRNMVLSVLRNHLMAGA